MVDFWGLVFDEEWASGGVEEWMGGGVGEWMGELSDISHQSQA